MLKYRVPILKYHLSFGMEGDTCRFAVDVGRDAYKSSAAVEMIAE